MHWTLAKVIGLCWNLEQSLFQKLWLVAHDKCYLLFIPNAGWSWLADMLGLLTEYIMGEYVFAYAHESPFLIYL